MAQPLLLDIGALSDGHTDGCLEHIHKALAEQPDAGDAALWSPHPNPALRAHVEAATRRLQMILERLQDALARLMLGAPIGELAKADTPWLRWDAARLAEVQMRLESRTPDDYTLEDWLLAVEFLLQAHLGDDVIRAEAEFVCVRSYLAGKVQEALAARQEGAAAGPAILAHAVQLLPTTFAAVPERVLTPVEMATLHVTHERAAQDISDVTASTRSVMRRICIEHIQAKVLGQREGTHQYLRQRLFDAFGVLNRDLRRVAISEAGECCNQGFILACPPGSYVKRHEAYKGCCSFCGSINGKVFKVIPAAEAVPGRDGWTSVWPGKTNVGRSASPRRRVGNELIERSESERWFPAAGVQHPNCRGAWVKIADAKPGVPGAFADWLDARLKQATA